MMQVHLARLGLLDESAFLSRARNQPACLKQHIRKSYQIGSRPAAPETAASGAPAGGLYVQQQMQFSYPAAQTENKLRSGTCLCVLCFVVLFVFFVFVVFCLRFCVLRFCCGFVFLAVCPGLYVTIRRGEVLHTV